MSKPIPPQGRNEVIIRSPGGPPLPPSVPDYETRGVQMPPAAAVLFVIAALLGSAAFVVWVMGL